MIMENRCNLCKMILPSSSRLREHLVEHTFVGCEERGFNCYICSAVFTIPSGLLNHMNEHGPNARPYDCNLCPEKFFFRAELDNHTIDHENGTIKVNNAPSSENITASSSSVSPKHHSPSPGVDIKTEVEDKLDENGKNEEEDEEYIEVEKVPEQKDGGNERAEDEEEEIEDDEQIDGNDDEEEDGEDGDEEKKDESVHED